MAALGGATAIGLRALFGAGDAGSALTTAAAAVGSVLAAVLAAGFAAAAARARTGATSPTAPLVAVARGLADGARATARHPVGRGVVPRAGRAPAGVRHQSTLLTLLLFRYAFTDAGRAPRPGWPGWARRSSLAAAGLGRRPRC